VPDRRGTSAARLGWALAAMVLICGSCTHSTPNQGESAEERLWSSDEVPTALDDPDDRAIQVGTAFTAASNGVITAVRFYQGPDNGGAENATLWTSDGTRIATATIPKGSSGWREIPFDEPVPVTADRTYIVSYRAARGHYSVDTDTFSRGRTVKSGWLEALGGVFTYGNGFPDQPSRGKNYYVDIVFRPTGPTLRTVDGGENYYAAFKNSFPTSPDFFPLGVWYTSTSSPEEIASDRALGLNTYVMLTAESNVQLIKESGMYALPNEPSAYSAGQLLIDEADMWAGAGDAPWNGKTPPDNPCIPEDAKCGYTVMLELRNKVPFDVLSYANYGKGVTFWLDHADAARFINDFQRLVSVDNYWFTDDAMCQASEGGALKTGGEEALSDSECHLAANYGITTKYVRSLVQPRAAMPFWNYVELGHPYKEGEGGTITGPQMRAAVWSSIINGARGIIYFVHNFGGPCLSMNLLRDHCGDAIRPDLMAVNQQIDRLAPVLNAPFVDGYAQSDGPVDLAVKRYDGSNYVLVGATRNEPSDATINLSCGNADSVEVVDENRTLSITNRSFHDSFADGNAVHLYKIDDTDGCALD
jgi:hypothetical protein